LRRPVPAQAGGHAYFMGLRTFGLRPLGRHPSLITHHSGLLAGYNPCMSVSIRGSFLPRMRFRDGFTEYVRKITFGVLAK
ncbi:hypothetical protein LR021_02075, partial [Candidatus Bipolaricaulota bacterium]|nr:hypothetical protein [Candidatus Bipolaricaulota bacterium]